MRYFIGALIGGLIIGAAFKTIQRDVEGCAFAQGAKSFADGYVGIDGKPIINFVSTLGDIEACARLGKPL